MSEDGGVEAERTRAEKLDAAKKKLKKLQAQKKGRLLTENVAVHKEPKTDLSLETKGETPENAFKTDDNGGSQTPEVKVDETLGNSPSLASVQQDSQTDVAEPQEKLQLSEELKQTRNALQAAETKNLLSTQSMNELQLRFQNVETENSSLMSECSRLEALCNRVQGDSQTEIELLRKQITDREAQADSLQARISGLTSEREQFKEEHDALVAQKVKSDNEAESHKAKSEAAERTHSTLRDQYTQMQTGSEQAHRELQHLNLQTKELSEENAVLKSRIVDLEAAVVSSKETAEKHATQDKQSQDKIKDLGSRNGKLQKENQDMILQLTELRQKIVELTDDKAEITGHLRTLEKNESDMKKALQEHSHEIETLRQALRQQGADQNLASSLHKSGQQKPSKASPLPLQETDESDNGGRTQPSERPASHGSRAEDEQAQHEEMVASLTEQHFRDLSAARAQIRNLESEMSKHQREARDTRRELEPRHNNMKDGGSNMGTADTFMERSISIDKGQTGHRMIPSPFVHLDITGFIPEDTIRIRETNLARLRRMMQDEASPDLLHRANVGVGTPKVL